MTVSGIGNRARLIWAIAVKDFEDSLRSKSFLAMIFMVALMIALYRFLPHLVGFDERPTVVSFDQGESNVMLALTKSDDVHVVPVDSYDELVKFIGREDFPTMGVVIPSDFDQVLDRLEEIKIEGLIQSWVREDDAEIMAAILQKELSELSNGSVEINLSRDVVTQSDGAFALNIALGLVLITGFIGMMYTSSIILQEIEERTIDALHVSPVTQSDLLIGKGIVGGVSSLVMASGVFMAYGHVIIHWWAIILATLAGVAFAVSLGMLLGSQVRSKAKLTLAIFILMQPMIFSVVLNMLDITPEGIRSILGWLPTAAMGIAAAQSIVPVIDFGVFSVNLLNVLIWSVLLFSLTKWLLRRAS